MLICSIAFSFIAKKMGLRMYVRAGGAGCLFLVFFVFWEWGGGWVAYMGVCINIHMCTHTHMQKYTDYFSFRACAFPSFCVREKAIA